jgi:hypothetical protein
MTQEITINLKWKTGKPNLKNGSLKIAHINACSSLPKIYLIELEMLNNDIILVSETHLSRASYSMADPL